MNNNVNIAIVQVSPVYYNLKQSLKKAIRLTEEAALKGAKIIVFGETWLPGYPAWLDYCPDAALWNDKGTKELFLTLRENSVAVPSDEVELLKKCCKKNKVVLIIGINEKINTGKGIGTLYNSILTINEKGELVNHHRKLMPTYTEKLLWGLGDARGLKSAKTKYANVGSLVCWEHWMPLSRQVLHDCGEQIHAALWPNVKEILQVASRHYAFEGRCFVLAAGLIMKRSDLPGYMKLPKNAPNLLLRGGSAVIGPDGNYRINPVFDKETIIYAKLNLQEIDKEFLTLDVSGHYSRDDIFDFKIKAIQ